MLCRSSLYMFKKITTLVIIFLIAFFQTAYAEKKHQPSPNACVTQNIDQVRFVGTGKLRFLGMDIYRASLFADAKSQNELKQFSLVLNYKKNIKGKAIAERSVYEMRKNGFKDEGKLNLFGTEMKRIFPDIKAGDELTGTALADGTTVFCQKGTELGRITDPEFTKHFFDIWLGQKTSVPKLRRQLLGL